MSARRKKRSVSRSRRRQALAGAVAAGGKHGRRRGAHGSDQARGRRLLHTEHHGARIHGGALRSAREIDHRLAGRVRADAHPQRVARRRDAVGGRVGDRPDRQARARSRAGSRVRERAHAPRASLLRARVFRRSPIQGEDGVEDGAAALLGAVRARAAAADRARGHTEVRARTVQQGFTPRSKSEKTVRDQRGFKKNSRNGRQTG